MCRRAAGPAPQEPEDPSSKSFFSEIIASISDVKFSPDGKYAISRDYLRLKVRASVSTPPLCSGTHTPRGIAGATRIGNQLTWHGALLWGRVRGRCGISL